MKKITLLCMIILLGLACQPKKDLAVKSDGIEKILPANIQFLVKLSSLKKEIENLGLNATTFFTYNMNDSISRAKADLGFNPFSSNEWRDFGIDIHKEIGFFINDVRASKEGSKGNLCVYLPIANEKIILENIEKFLKKEKFSVKKSENNLNIYELGNIRISLLSKANYLFVIVNKGETSLLEQLKNTQENLAQNKNYQKLVAKTGNESILLYGNIKKVLLANNEFISEFLKQNSLIKNPINLLGDYENMAMHLETSSKDLRLKVAVAINPNSQILKVYQGVVFNKKPILNINGKLVSTFSWAFNIKEYIKTLKKLYPAYMIEQISMGIRAMEKELEINAAEDILENLTGNISLGIYDGKTINFTNYNAFVAIGVKDSSKMMDNLKKLVGKIPLPGGNVFSKKSNLNMITKKEDHIILDIMGMMKLYIYGKEEHIYVTIGENMFKKIKDGGTAHLPDDFVTQIMKGDYQIAYLNIDEFLHVIKNFSMLLAKFTGNEWNETMEAQIKQFKYILFYGGIEENIGYGEFFIKSRFNEPFIKAFSKMLSK